MSSPSGSKSKLSSVTLAALGVVFGDIGTSPLYTIKEVFSVGEHPVPVSYTHLNITIKLTFNRAKAEGAC